jgi:hypothetical protein
MLVVNTSGKQERFATERLFFTGISKNESSLNDYKILESAAYAKLFLLF